MDETNTLILLVDDEKTVLDSLGTELGRAFGETFDVECAESAAEAWEVLEHAASAGTHVVVVVSDWLMPGERGDQFLARVRERFPRTGRILLTGHADPAALSRAQSIARVHEIVLKPWQPEALQSAIRRSIGAE